jgi:hypothetical protein
MATGLNINRKSAARMMDMTSEAREKLINEIKD